MYLYPDLETYSDLDIRKVSLDRYASHPSTRILMCAWAVEDEPIRLWQEGDSKTELVQALKNHTNVPWNCGFERTLISRVWRLDGLRWRDAMIDALYAGLPAGLKDCNRVPYFANEAETSKESLLINKFCKPQKDGTIRNRETDPEDWAKFCSYCCDDVHDTRLIFKWCLARFDMPERVMRAWEIDQRINERGMPVDRLLTYRAWEEAQRLQAESADKLTALTGLPNANSPAQLLKWVVERGYPYTGLGKELVLKALKDEGIEDNFVDD